MGPLYGTYHLYLFACCVSGSLWFLFSFFFFFVINFSRSEIRDFGRHIQHFSITT